MCSWCPHLASFSHRRAVDTNEARLIVLGRLCQFVVSGGNCAGAPGVRNDRAGPQRGVFTRSLILIPAMAAARLPDGALQAPIDISDKVFLSFRTHFQDMLLVSLHERQTAHHIADL